MTISLWRHEPIGERLSPHSAHIRFGRRQNALLCTKKVTNAVPNALFHNNAQGWSLWDGSENMEAVFVPEPAPFSYGALRIARKGAGLGYARVGRYVDLDSANPPNGARQARWSVYIKGPIGTKLQLLWMLPDQTALISTHPVIEKEGWQRYSVTATPPTNSQIQAWVAVGLNVDTQYLGPIYVTGAQHTWDVSYQAPFVAEGYGTTKDSFLTSGYEQTGQGTAFDTDVWTNVPPDVLKRKGSTALWYFQEDGGVTFPEALAHFRQSRSANQGSFSVGLTGAKNVYVQTNDDGGTSNVQWAIPFHSAEGQTWYHIVITWVDNTYTCYVNGVNLGTKTTSRHVVRPVNFLTLGSYLANVSGEEGHEANGLLEGFTVYDRTLAEEEVKSIYAAGDNLQTGAILHAGFFDNRPVFEIGECVGFMHTGDYWVEQGGYTPGASKGQPTVRFASHREAQGPYIVASRYSTIIEDIRFTIKNELQTGKSLARKVRDLDNLLERTASSQRLVLHYSPLHVRRNLRAAVRTAHLTKPQAWSGPEQAISTMKSFLINLERDRYQGARRSLGRIVVPRPDRTGATPAADPIGVLKLAPVEGSVPAPMVLSTDFASAEPTSFVLGVRRKAADSTPLFWIPQSAEPDMWGSGLNPDVVFVTDSQLIGQQYVKWTQATITTGEVKLGTLRQGVGLDQFLSHGDYRVFALCRVTAGFINLAVKVKIGQHSSQSWVPSAPGNPWLAADLGVMNYPGEDPLQPFAGGWRETPPEIYTVRESTTGTFEFHFLGLLFQPADDGMALAFTDSNSLQYLVENAVVDGRTGIVQERMLQGYSRGMELDPRTVTELRGWRMWYHADGDGNPRHRYADYPVPLLVEYIPVYAGIGDE